MNKRATVLLAAACLFLAGSGRAFANPDNIVKLRVFEGLKEGVQASQSVTSSYLKHTSAFILKSSPVALADEAALAAEQEQIKRTFNLKDVRLLSESAISWGAAQTPPSRSMFRLDGQLYEVALAAKDAPAGAFQIVVNEVGDKKTRSLLDTAFTLPARNVAVFGFEDSGGKPYFISLRTAEGTPAEAGAGVSGGPRPEDVEKFAVGAVKVKDKIPPPKIVTKVNPVYPEAARKSGLQGVVILQARTDTQGKVKDVMVLRSVSGLDQAAIDAVKQWVYEPLVIDGTAREAVFTTTIAFKLNGEKKEGGATPVAAKDEVQPKLVSKVNPVYPEAARKAGIQGIVLIEATISKTGDVVAVKVLKSVPELDQAAIDAVKQWKYEPVVIEGKPVGIVFTVTIKFALQ